MAAAHPAPGANHDLPAAAWAGSRAPHSPGRGTRLGRLGVMTLAQEQPRGPRSTARSQGTPEAPLALGAGPGAVTALGRGPGGLCSWKGSCCQLLPAEESLAWLGGCHCLLPQLPGMLLPHHLPGFAPKSPPWGSVPLSHHRDISMLSLPAQDGIMCVAFGCREEHLARCCPEAQDCLHKRRQRSHQGPNRALPTPKTIMGTHPGHLQQPQRCKQAPGKPCPKTWWVPKNSSGDGDGSLPLGDSDSDRTGPSWYPGGAKSQLLPFLMYLENQAPRLLCREVPPRWEAAKEHPRLPPLRQSFPDG